MKKNESKKRKEQTYFSKVWLQDEDFKKCLCRASENTQARLQFNKMLNFSNTGRQALVSHAAGKKHKTLTNGSQTFFSVEQQFLT